MRFRLPSRSSLPRAALTIGAGVLAGFLALPIVAVVLSLGDGASPVVAHLMDTVLFEHITNSLMLSLAVAIGTIAVGVPAAWFVTMHAFPGRRLLEIVLVLPLAMPAYVIAYAYTDLFQPAGPVQIFLRDLFELAPGTIVLPEIRSLPGAAIIFTAVLYPYVYLLARASFLEQSVCVLEASRTLGHGRFSTFFRVGLPLARPAIAAGTALALMETLADFGAVSYFGVQTFTTGIYRAWFSWGDPVAAQQLATGLLAFVLLLHALERISRGRARHFHATNRYRPLPHDALTGARGIGAAMLCALPGVFGFFLPVIALVRLAMVSEISPLSPRFIDAAGHSIILSLGAALIAVAGALIIAFAARGGRSLVARLASRIGELGYAVPGPVIAVGILVPLIG
ncbi:MAG TPA: iron ABC transporter permease, partial [Micropepsaceae bacterium]|nr:iron ABC transporter permease [Micropepsaceae bacterium]